VTLRATLTQAMLELEPENTMLVGLSVMDLMRLRDHHYRKDGLSERTAYNYCRTFWQFLVWCADTPEIGFVMPRGSRDVFKLRKPSANADVPTVAQVKRLMQVCHGAERLWVLLGLNCGMYEADISELVADDIRGDCLWWDREKQSHTNQFRTLHWLFPETRALMDEIRQQSGRLFLHPDGKPYLYFENGKRKKRIGNIIAKRGVIPFKSLRKFSASWMAKQKDGERLARQFLGHKPPGMLRPYVRDDFSSLTKALGRYRLWLIRQGVLNPDQSSPPTPSGSGVEE